MWFEQLWRRRRDAPPPLPAAGPLGLVGERAAVEALAAIAAWVHRYDTGEWDDPPGKLALLYDLERVAQLIRDGEDPFDPQRDRPQLSSATCSTTSDRQPARLRRSPRPGAWPTPPHDRAVRARGGRGSAPRPGGAPTTRRTDVRHHPPQTHRRGARRTPTRRPRVRAASRRAAAQLRGLAALAQHRVGTFTTTRSPTSC